MKRVKGLIILLLAVLFLYFIASSVIAFILQQVLKVFGWQMGFIQLLGWCSGLGFVVFLICVLIIIAYRVYLINKLAKRFGIYANQLQWVEDNFDLFKNKGVKSWSKEQFGSWMDLKIKEKQMQTVELVFYADQKPK